MSPCRAQVDPVVSHCSIRLSVYLPVRCRAAMWLAAVLAGALLISASSVHGGTAAREGIAGVGVNARVGSRKYQSTEIAFASESATADDSANMWSAPPSSIAVSQLASYVDQARRQFDRSFAERELALQRVSSSTRSCWGTHTQTCMQSFALTARPAGGSDTLLWPFQ